MKQKVAVVRHHNPRCQFVVAELHSRGQVTGNSAGKFGLAKPLGSVAGRVEETIHEGEGLPGAGVAGCWKLGLFKDAVQIEGDEQGHARLI
jgi:hypothetical protein